MASTSAFIPTLDLNQGEPDNDDDEADFMCFGRFRSVVVGIQYYTGTVNNNEMVQLVREPHNQYDRFAFRVDNVRGQRVGHLKKELVCHLAPLVDQKQLRLEGVVPSGSNNRFTLPVVIYCYGPAAAEHSTLQSLKMANAVMEAVDANVTITGGVPDQLMMARITQSEMEACLDRLFADMLNQGRPREFMEPVMDVVSPLYPHQKQALAWMVRREIGGELPPFWEPRKPRTATGPPLTYVNTLTNFCSDTRPLPLRGGILADDMGLGKTLDVISLIATNRAGVPLPQIAVEILDEPALPPPAAKRRKTNKGMAPIVPPNINLPEANISPLGLPPGQVPQLQPSPLQHDHLGGPALHLHPNTMPTHSLQPQQQLIPPPKPQHLSAVTPTSMIPYLQPQPAKKLSKAQTKLLELAAAESPPAELPLLGGAKATLIVCPVSVMSNWVTQVEEHTSGSLQVYQYHGADRNRSVEWLQARDIVVTTYSTLAQEMVRGGADGLLAVKWLRVVLDEAHIVKNPRTQQCRAAHMLQATYRWAVTGTPIQNTLSDLYALLSWLRVEPLQDRTLFNRTIERPIRANDARGLIRLQILLSGVALRRTKDLNVNGRPVVDLPSRTVHITPVSLTPEDRLKYDRWELEGRRIISHHISAATLLSNYSNVLEIILRLRQICCAGSLCPADVPGSDLEAGNPLPASAPASPELLQRLLMVLQSGGEECPICLAELQLPCITRCGHPFCRRCIEQVITMDKPLCPMCRQHVGPADLFDPPPEASTDSRSASPEDEAAATANGNGLRQRSAKVALLMQHLMAAARQGIKSVVFSQFTGMMDLVAAALREDGLPYVRLDGSTNARLRALRLEQFASMAPGSPMVFLSSLRAGGVGLNLTSASHVHLLDPWWNPAVEEQAMDRVHRLGQLRPVEVFRYVAESTIEERMLRLQERKRELSRAAFERRSPDQQRQMRIDDVKLLMEL